MYVRSVYTRRVNFSLNPSPLAGNQLTVLTGPNGSGKTEALVALADFFAFPPQKQSVVDVSHHPARVIAQTFSPFSRFRAPKRTTRTIFDIYVDEVAEGGDYAAVGMHKGQRYAAGSFARTVLENALFQLSEDTERFTRIGDVLTNVGYEATFDLAYRAKPGMKDLLGAWRENRIHEFLKLRERPSPRAIRTLEREGQDSGVERLLEMLSTALDVIGETLTLRPPYKHRIYLDRKGRGRNFAETQAFAVLRRLNLLALASCSLSRSDGATVELANASSGQQQMLCSLLGLAAELQDDALVVIDEPELSLHPTWQRQFMDDLLSVLGAVRACHIVIATHSPILVQRAQELGVEVVALKSGHQVPVQATPSVPSVEEALVEVFKSPVPNSLYLANEVAHLVNEAEESSTSTARSVQRLRSLQAVYTSGKERDLLDSAMEVIEGAEEA